MIITLIIVSFVFVVCLLIVDLQLIDCFSMCITVHVAACPFSKNGVFRCSSLRLLCMVQRVHI